TATANPSPNTQKKTPHFDTYPNLTAQYSPTTYPPLPQTRFPGPHVSYCEYSKVTRVRHRNHTCES
ncbi:hypothetical protein C7212DRAFT_308613, partial [Tuber magnatum]